jgi:transcriptional regulator with GAF, ATPase, and Fis domain
VRELENVLERAIITNSGATLCLTETLAAGRQRPCACVMVRSLRDVEREHILRILELAGWTIEGSRGAAAILGLKASTLRSRMRRLGIPRRPARADPPPEHLRRQVVEKMMAAAGGGD